MTVAEDYRGMAGAILLYEPSDSVPLPVIIYSADGSIAVGDAVPDDDDQYEDDPRTDAEIEHDFRVSMEIAERNARGESVRTQDPRRDY
jgi:hypothetical protein